MSEHPISSFCRVILSQPDIRKDLEDASRALVDEPENHDRIFNLLLALYRSSAFKACLQLSAAFSTQNPDLQNAVILLSGVCLEVQGLSEEAEATRARLEALDLTGQYVCAVLEEVYQTANVAFNRGELDIARSLYNMGLVHDTRLHTVNAGNLGESLDMTPGLDAEVEKLLGQLNTAESQEIADADLPTVAQSLRAISKDDIDSIKGRKVLLILRERMHQDSKMRKCEMGHNFQVTAVEAGLEMRFLSADPFLFHWMYTDEERVGALKEMAAVIADFRPDAVVFDCFCGNLSDTRLTPQMYASAMKKLKSLFHFKLISLYPDAYEAESTWAINFTSDFVDSVWLLSHLAYLEFEPEAQAKCSVVPFPYVYSHDELDLSTKDIDTAFLGTSKRYNFLRSLWFLAMEDAEIPYELFLTDPKKTPNRLSLSHEEYGAFLGRIRTCIQFSARNVTTKIMCGRVWESMMVGCALLEEENIETKELLLPYVHYVPFSSLRELAVAVECLRKYPDARDKMARRGHAWVQDLLSSDKLWAYMLLKA